MSPLESYIAPARARPQLWRICLGALACVVVYLVGLNLMAAYLAGHGIGMAELARAETPRAVLLLMASFGWMLLGPAVAVRVLHHRRPGTLFGPARTVIRDFRATALVVGGVQGAAMMVWFLSYDALPNLAFSTWLMLLPLAVAGIALQTAAEEAVFRGYLLQQLAARFRSPLAWALVPAALFGLLHYQSGLGAEGWALVLATLIIGLIAADLTALTGSLGAAWGMHFANNAAALLVLATDDALPGLALYTTPYPASDLGWLIVGDVLVLLVAWAAARRVLAR